jgi:adenylylsulfate kinase
VDTVTGPVDVLAQGPFVGLDEIEGGFPHGSPNEKGKAGVADEGRPVGSSDGVHHDGRIRRCGPFSREDVDLDSPVRKRSDDGVREPLRSPVRIILVSDEGDLHGMLAMDRRALIREVTEETRMDEMKATNIVWHSTHVERWEREELLRQEGCTVWLTGLPASGKSTTSFTLEHALIQAGYLAYVLDGDNVRHGLNKNLGFSPEDREENIRRIGEVAKLFADAGVIVMTSFISPYRRDRDAARALHREAGLPFIEVFVDTPVEICEERDPKGLYMKAKKGELKGFTGVDDPYEPPLRPEIVVNTMENSPEECAEQILAYLRANALIKTRSRETIQ